MIPNKNTFCIAPYQHACVNSKGNLKICCMSKEKPKYNYKEIKEWYNSDTLNSLRHNLLNGIKDPICNDCWVAEKSNKKSQRQIYNKHIGKILENNWNNNFKRNKKFIEIIKKIDYKNINSFDLKLGNLCNLKCIMCNSDSSSQLLAEARMYTELQEFSGNKDIKDYQWPKKKDFNDWCKTFLGSSIHIKFTGGEPFMNPYLLESLEYIPEEQKKKCILQFLTNLTIINDEIMKTLKKFKETWIDVSVEGIGNVFEYARFGHKWADLEKNLTLLMNNKSKNLFITVSNVIQAPTFTGIIDLVRFFDNKKIKLSPLFLSNPECFKLSSIKKKYKEDFLNRLENYKGFNIYYINAVKSFVKENIEHDQKLANQCVYRLKIFDRVRKNNFQEIIPVDYFI